MLKIKNGKYNILHIIDRGISVTSESYRIPFQLVFQGSSSVVRVYRVRVQTKRRV